MKVYVVEIGNYDDHYIFGIFQSLTDAHAALIDCEEFDLDTQQEPWSINGNNGDYLDIFPMEIGIVEEVRAT